MAVGDPLYFLRESFEFEPLRSPAQTLPEFVSLQLLASSQKEGFTEGSRESLAFLQVLLFQFFSWAQGVSIR
jgi:hypothetical protein